MIEFKGSHFERDVILWARGNERLSGTHKGTKHIHRGCWGYCIAIFDQ